MRSNAFRVGFFGKTENDRITVDYMILLVGITVSRRKVLCDLRKLVDHCSALSLIYQNFIGRASLRHLPL